MPWNTGLSGFALEIAQSNDRHLRVMAGPGTGKTFAMKRKVARHLEEGVDPRRILAVTFTRTAAANLVRELHELGIRGCENVRAGTLHSFCFSVLSRADVLAYSGRVPRPLITFDKSGVTRFEGAPLLQDLDNQDLYGTQRERTRRVRAFEANWARLQSDEPGWAQDPVDQQFQDALIAWLRFHNAMLIGELVPEALRYVRDNPVCPERNAFDYVVVDEYQDLNRAEQVLLDLLSTNGSLSVIGDEDQSIYRFRYAHPEGITEFAHTHPGTRDKHLVECRRCPTRIVHMADRLIRFNHAGEREQRLTPMPGNADGEIHIVQWVSLDEEVDELSRFVEYLVLQRGYDPGDILLLCPRRLIGYSIRDALVARGITTHSFYHEEALEARQAQAAFALLTLLANHEDRVALRYWLGFESPTWCAGQYRTLRDYCERTGLSPWNALQQLHGGEVELRRTGDLVMGFRELLAGLEALRPLSGTELIDGLFPPNQPWAGLLREASLSDAAEEVDAATLLDRLRIVITQPEIPEASDFVRVMSLHKSKGLTSKVVIIGGCIQGLIPSSNEDETPVERQATLREQRRLFYVAITRATEMLVISSATHLDRQLAHSLGARVRRGGGRAGSTVTSEFIAQLGPTTPRPRTGTEWRDSGYSQAA